jgi:hypothetical protein
VRAPKTLSVLVAAVLIAEAKSWCRRGSSRLDRDSGLRRALRDDDVCAVSTGVARAGNASVLVKQHVRILEDSAESVVSVDGQVGESVAVGDRFG